MANHERPPFLRTPPVHCDFLRTLDELATASPAERMDEFTEKSSQPYDEERWAWHRPGVTGGRQAG